MSERQYAVAKWTEDSCDALTLAEARLLAEVNHRAGQLQVLRYQARRVGASEVVVCSPRGEQYVIDEREQTCSCPFFVRWRGKYPCKHLLGYPALLGESQASNNQ